MGLPQVTVQRSEVELPEGMVPVRGLNRAEVIEMAKLEGDIAAMEITLLKYGTESSQEEVEAWYHTAANDAVIKLVNEIGRLSGLDGMGK